MGDNAASTRITLNTIYITLSSFSEITDEIRALENRFYPAEPASAEPASENGDKKECTSDTLSELMDRFANYIPLYCNTIIDFKCRFNSEFLGIHVAEVSANNNEKSAAELSKLDRCFAAINRLQHARTELEDLIIDIRGGVRSEEVDSNGLDKNIFCFLANCNEILIHHKERMFAMIRELSDMLLLEAG